MAYALFTSYQVPGNWEHVSVHEGVANCDSLVGNCRLEYNNGSWPDTISGRASTQLHLVNASHVGGPDNTTAASLVGAPDTTPLPTDADTHRWVERECDPTGIDRGFRLLQTALDQLAEAASPEAITLRERQVERIRQNEAWTSCWEFINQMSEYGEKNQTIPLSTDCVEEWETDAWRADPCCNWALRWTECCAPRDVTFEFHGMLGARAESLQYQCGGGDLEAAEVAAANLADYMTLESTCRANIDYSDLWSSIDEQRRECEEAVFNPPSGDCDQTTCFSKCVNNVCIVQWDNPFDALAACYA